MRGTRRVSRPTLRGVAVITICVVVAAISVAVANAAYEWFNYQQGTNQVGGVWSTSGFAPREGKIEFGTKPVSRGGSGTSTPTIRSAASSSMMPIRRSVSSRMVTRSRSARMLTITPALRGHVRPRDLSLGRLRSRSQILLKLDGRRWRPEHSTLAYSRDQGPHPILSIQRQSLPSTAIYPARRPRS